jgi:M6 family metalloprotease-like protein
LRRALAAGPLLLAAASVLAGEEEEAPLPPSAARTVAFALPSPEEAFLGVSFVPRTVPPRVRAVVPWSPAASAGLREGDEIASIGGVEPPDAVAALWMIRLRVPGETVRVDILRGAEARSLPVTLDRRPGEGAFFRGAAFRLAVVPLALEDLPRPAEPSDRTLDRMVFSRGAHRGTLPSGRVLRGSLRDYFHDQSFGALEVKGRVLPTLEVPAPRRAFALQPMGAGPDSLYARAAGILLARDGPGALDAYDGIAFLYGGPVASPPRRGMWPHRGTLRAGGRVIPYFVKNTGEGEPEPVGVLCHEFGHLLGLPDQYGTAHRTGVGDWCLMAIGHRGGGASGADRPFGICAWCRTVLGWVRPAPVDPFSVPDLVLDGAARGPGEAFLVPGAEEGEAFLLENRRREGWDGDLPGEGLLVWRAGAPLRAGESPDTPWLDLVEAHGIDVPDASLLRPDEVPFPARRRDALAAESHGPRAGHLRLSRIRRLPGGRVAFRIGDPSPVRAPPPEEVPVAVDREGFASLLDPVTGERVRVYMGPPEEAPAREVSEVEAVEPVTGD